MRPLPVARYRPLMPAPAPDPSAPARRGDVEPWPGRRRGVLALLAGLFLTKLAIAAWGVNRGFDLGDGGFFLLNLNRPEESPPLFEFYKLLLLFEPPLRFGPISARALRIATELVATLALAHGVFRFTQARLPRAAAVGFPFLLLFGLMGSLLSVAAREFGYNDATNLLTFSACACLFRLLALPAGAAGGPGRLAWAGGAGLLLGLQLAVKFPSSLLLVGITVLLVVGFLRASARERIGILACHGLGLSTAVLLFVAANGGIDPLLARVELAIEVNRVTGYSIPEILHVYVSYDRGSHVNLLRFALAFAGGLGFAYWLLRGRAGALDRALTLALVAGGLVLLRGVWKYHAGNVHPWLLALYCSVLLLAVVSWLLAYATWRPADTRRESSRWQALAPLLLLLVLPFVEIAGTNVTMTLRLPTHVFPIFLMLGVLTSQLRGSGYRWFCDASLGALAAVSSLVFTSHHVERPYGLAAPLYRQVHEAPGLPGLRVDLATRVFLERLRSKMSAAGFRPGDPVIAIDFMPGLVYFLRARSPGFPFYPFDRPEQNCWAIARAGDGEVPFLILGKDMSHEQHTCIRAFQFPQEFRSLGTLNNPYELAIRYFFGGPSMPYVELFAPRERLDAQER